VSAYKAVTLKCDGPTCTDEFNGDLDDSAFIVREWAKREGWANKGSKDYCPKHNPMDTVK
jgi:hypothetical protein